MTTPQQRDIIRGMLQELGLYANTRLELYDRHGGNLLRRFRTVDDLQVDLEARMLVAGNLPFGEQKTASEFTAAEKQEIDSYQPPSDDSYDPIDLVSFRKWDFTEEVDVGPFEFKTEPFQHQRWLFAKTRDLEYSALFAEMGTGKTKVMLDTASHLYQHGQIQGLIVVAPKGVHSKWVKTETSKHVHDEWLGTRVHWTPEDTKKKQRLIDTLYGDRTQGLRLFSFNYEAVITKRGKDALFKFAQAFRCMLVIDESHSVKNPKAQRTAVLMELARLCPYRRILTGTPITQGPTDLFCQFEILKPGILGFKYYGAFQSRYETRILNPALRGDLAKLVPSREACQDLFALRMRQMPAYSDIFAIADRHGVKFDYKAVMSLMRKAQTIHGNWKNLAELSVRVNRIAYRITKDEALDLPERSIEEYEIQLSKTQARVYKEFRDQLAVEIEERVMSTDHALTKMLRLRQVLGGHYVDDLDPDAVGQRIEEGLIPREQAVLDLIEWAGEGEKWVIWSSFRTEILALKAMLEEKFYKGAVGVIMGQDETINGCERYEMNERFQDRNSEVRFIVANPRAGGTGLDFTAARYAIYYSHDYSSANYMQSLDRTHRIGQDRNVFVYRFVAPGTIDRAIISCLNSKRDVADMILEGKISPTEFMGDLEGAA